MAFGSSDDISFDLTVNGKPAVDSIEDVEKAQNDLDKTVTKTTKNIKMNWVAVGASVVAVGAAMSALATKALTLEKAMFGLNAETKKWIQSASSKYGVEQGIIANFVRTGKTAGMAGEEIAKMIDQAIALDRAYPEESLEGFIDNLVMLNRTGEAQGFIVDVIEQKYGQLDMALLSNEQKMLAVEEAVKGVNEAYDKTDAAKAEKSMNELNIAATNLGSTLLQLGSESGAFGVIQDGLDWIADKAKKATDALSKVGAMARAEAEWNAPFPSDKPAKNKPIGAPDVEGKAKASAPFEPNITKKWIDYVVRGNQKLAAEQKRASDKAASAAKSSRSKAASSAKSAADAATREREKEIANTLAMNVQFWDDYNEATMTAYEYDLNTLNEQYEEYKKHVTDKAALDEWYNAEKKECLKRIVNRCKPMLL